MNDSTGAILGLSSAVLFVLLYVWYSLALSALFAKTGVDRWKAWIPVLNAAMILKLGGFSPWLVLLNLVPLFGGIAFVVVAIVAIHRINLGFGRGAGMTVLGALVQIVWASVLGFGSARWNPGPSDRVAAPREESAPVRRGSDFAGPYVPLVGGWTPEPGAGSRAAGGDASHAEPVTQPFAAPSSSLSDAVPAPVDWAAPATEAVPVPADGPRRTGPEAASVFDVLEALRSDAPAARRAETDAEPVRARVDPDDANGFQPTLPLTPAAPNRGRALWPADPPAPAVASAEVPETPEPAETAAPSPAPASRPAATEDPAIVPLPWSPPRRTEERRAERDAGEAGAVEHREAAPSPAPVADGPLTRPSTADASETPLPPHDPPATHGDEFPEFSEAVSAVSEAPDAGAPRSARTSVAALYTQSELPVGVSADDDLDALDRTVVARRRRIPWALIAPSGESVDLTSSVVIVGRRPAVDASFPDAQLISIVDETRTVSKTHARLVLRGDTWFVTDLDSTNGVLFASLMGTEIEAPPGEEIEAGERFFLGDAEVRLSRRDA